MFFPVDLAQTILEIVEVDTLEFKEDLRIEGGFLFEDVLRWREECLEHFVFLLQMVFHDIAEILWDEQDEFNLSGIAA